MQPLCQLCCNPKRRLRFHTERLAICQWCVTELSTSNTSPAKILDELRSSAISRHQESARRELARHRGLISPPPDVPSAALDAVSRYAEGAVRRDEGIFQSLYRSMVDDTKRRDEVATVAARRRDEILAVHRSAIADHALRQREIETKIRVAESNLARVPENVEHETQQFLDAAKIAEPTKSKDMRLVRAFYAGLINFERTECARPESLEYEEQKRRIRARDSYRCVCCLRGFAKGELHVHHVIPLSRCGTNADFNLVTLCHPCHNKQHPDFQVTRSFPIKRSAPISRFVAVDIETTGLSNEDSIIEIAAVRFVGGGVEAVFCSLVRSKKVIPAAVIRLTGITQSMIVEAPHPEVVIREFVEFISNHRLVFHNAPFDMRFIGRYLEYFNYPAPNRILDTLLIARRKLPDISSHRLADLVEHLGLPVTRSHRAQDDSLATGHLYLALRGIATPRTKKKRKASTVIEPKQPRAVTAARRDA